MKTKKKKMPIQSHIKERLVKIRTGNVYDGKLTFIRELGQNALRANATKIWMTLKDNVLIIEDNGDGCDEPKKLFTLDYSGFGVGFGEGFTSIYMVADEFEVKTTDWKAKLNIVDKIDNPKTTDADLTVDIEDNDEYTNGFHLTLIGEDIERYSSDIYEEVQKMFMYIPHIDAYINGEPIIKRNLFEKLPDGDYCEVVNNRYYSGRISLTPSYFESGIEVYFEYRYVQTLPLDGAKGVILLKPNAVNLRAPDRTSVIFDEKRNRLMNNLQKVVKNQYKKLVSNAKKDEIDKYAQIIQEYLDVKEYINYLTIDNSFLLQFESNDIEELESVGKFQTPKAKDFYEVIDNFQAVDLLAEKELTMETETNVESETEEQLTFSNFNPVNEMTDRKIDVIKFDKGEKEIIFEEVVASSNASSVAQIIGFPEGHIIEETTDTIRKLHDREFSSTVKVNEYVKKEHVNTLTLKDIRKKKNIVWCSIDEKERYQHYISEFEYKNIYTFISPHVLYDKALEYYGIPHVTEYESCIVEEYEVTKTGARNKKEERAMELLSFIEKKYGLSETFFVSEIKCKRKIELNGKKVHQEKVTVNGYKQFCYIHLNRKSLFFGNLKGSRLGDTTLNIHDLKFIVANSSLIGHELAHLLYGTKDNTKEHLEKEKQLRDEIVDFFIKQ